MYKSCLLITALLALFGSVHGLNNVNQMYSLCEQAVAEPVVDVYNLTFITNLIEQRWSYVTKFIKCPDAVKKSIMDLKSILQETDVCSREHANKITNFYWLQVDKASSSRKDLHEVLRELFLFYATHVNNLCKQALANYLPAATAMNIAPGDFERIASVRMDKLFLNVLGKKMNLENLGPFVEPGNFSTDTDEKVNRLLEKAAPDDTDGYLYVEQLCTNKLKPVYDKLLVPVIKLEYFGFNYETKLTAQLMKWLEAGPYYENWFKAVYVCESVVRIKAIRKKAGAPSRLSEMRTTWTVPSLKSIDFIPNVGVHPKTTLVVRSDKSLAKAIKRLDSDGKDTLLGKFERMLKNITN